MDDEEAVFEIEDYTTQVHFSYRIWKQKIWGLVHQVEL